MYGVIRVEGRNIYAHRLAWEIAANRPVPAGQFVLHRCDNPPCCNPSHLFIGTVKDNTADMFAKNRANKARGERHHGAKITAEDVREIRRRYEPRVVTAKHLAAEYGLNHGYVRLILCRRRWAHVL